MTIPKISSQDLNEILSKAKDEINSVKNKMDNTKNDITKKIKIIGYEADYMNREISNLKNGAYLRSNNLKTFNKYCEGIYNIYGSSVTPDFIKKPVNLFNMQTSTSGEIFFRNDVNVTINNETDKFNLNILKHDSVNNKEISFYELDNNELTLEITMNSQNQLGPARFNMIEIDPFLPGSFDIETISIFYKNQDGATVVAPRTYNNIKSVGKQRILLNQKYDFYKIIFKIKLNYVMSKNDINIYPFGLKHLYFYEADLKNDSYIITTLDRQQYISIIKDEIYMITSTGEYISTLDKEKIEVYSTYNNGNFEDRIYPSTALERNEIARNINTLYIKIPLKANQAIIGIGFHVETKKQDLFYNNNNVIYIDRIIRDDYLEGPYYSKTIPHDIISIPASPQEDNILSKKDKAPTPVYSTLPGFGKNNNLFEHKVSEGFILKSDTNIPFDDISINSNNIYMIKNNNGEKISLIFENNKDKYSLFIKSVYPLDYDSQYTIYFKQLSLINGVVLPNYKAEFSTEDYDINIQPTQYFVPTTNYKIKIEFGFEPDEDYLNDKYIYIIDKNSNKIVTNAQYSNGYLIVSAKAKLQEKQPYHVYIKKGIKNNKRQKVLVKTIKQTFFTGVNQYDMLSDKLYVPLSKPIEVNIQKVVDVAAIANSEYEINDCIYILNEHNHKIPCDIKCNISSKTMIISPKIKFDNNSEHLLVVDQETPIIDVVNTNLGKTIVQKIITRNEELDIEEMDDNSNIELGRFSVPSKYYFKYKFKNTLNINTITKDNIIVLNKDFNIINYELKVLESNTILIELNKLKKDSRYYVIFNNSILSINGAPLVKGLKIITLTTENSGIDELTELFLIPNDKIFSVNLGTTIGQECLNNKYVYIIDSDNKIVPTLINQPMNGCLSIKPPDNDYNYWSQYTLIVDKFIKDSKGISLLKPQLQKFNIIDNKTNIEYSTIDNVTNSYAFNIEMPSNISEEYLTSDYIYIVDSNYHKLENINIEYGMKDDLILSNMIRISPAAGSTYPLDNLKLVISKDIKLASNVQNKTKIIMFKVIAPQY